MNAIRSFVSDPWVLGVWAALVALSLAAVIFDLAKNNTGIMPLMKAVWGLTVLYSGPLGLAIYWFTGRKWIRRDSLWRRAWRSDAHCYSGCGAGEIVGVAIMGGLLAAGNWPTAAVTFTLAYLFGFALTVGPMVQGGMAFAQAVKDALWAETLSITVMEVAAIGVDLWLAQQAGWNDPLFWGSGALGRAGGLAEHRHAGGLSHQRRPDLLWGQGEHDEPAGYVRRGPPADLLAKQIRMCPSADQDHLGLRAFVNEQPIRLHMTFTGALIRPMQGIIPRLRSWPGLFVGWV